MFIFTQAQAHQKYEEQRMYEMLLFTIGFDEFEFSRIFFLLIVPIKNCEKIQINVKFQKETHQNG